jgi:hypothetical protein
MIKQIPGFKIDEDKIAAGLWEMIKEHPDFACVRLGMLPAEIMNSLEREFEERIPDIYFVSGDPLFTIKGEQYRHKVLHSITCKILNLADAAGVLEV